MRKLSSRTVKVTAGRFVRDILLKGSAASWPNVFPFLWLLFKETAVFIRRLRCERVSDTRHVGGDAGLGCCGRLPRSLPVRFRARWAGTHSGPAAVLKPWGGVFEWNDLELFPEMAFVCPFLPVRSREDEPVGHGFHFVPCRAFYFSFNLPKKKSQEFATSPPLCLQHQALLLNTATHLLFILIPEGFGGPTCFTDCCGSLIFSIKSKGRAAGRKRRRGCHEIQYIG